GRSAAVMLLHQQAATGCIGASMGPRPFSRGDVGSCVCAACVLEPLQWGRGRSAAVMIGCLFPNEVRVEASMGPRPFSRGDLQPLCTACNTAKGASMGPRPFSR